MKIHTTTAQQFERLVRETRRREVSLPPFQVVAEVCYYFGHVVVPPIDHPQNIGIHKEWVSSIHNLLRAFNNCLSWSTRTKTFQLIQINAFFLKERRLDFLYPFSFKRRKIVPATIKPSSDETFGLHLFHAFGLEIDFVYVMNSINLFWRQSVRIDMIIKWI